MSRLSNLLTKQETDLAKAEEAMLTGLPLRAIASLLAGKIVLGILGTTHTPTEYLLNDRYDYGLTYRRLGLLAGVDYAGIGSAPTVATCHTICTNCGDITASSKPTYANYTSYCPRCMKLENSADRSDRLSLINSDKRVYWAAICEDLLSTDLQLAIHQLVILTLDKLEKAKHNA